MIAVLGAYGQLGRDLLALLPPYTLALSRAEIDLENPETIQAWFAKNQPQSFINCAAYNLVDAAETDLETAFRVNAYGPRALAMACVAAGTRLVHISTDYVFGLDATRKTPLLEDDTPGPVSAYGLSKLTGEQFVRMVDPSALIVRTCGLYGLHGVGGKGSNFVETMLRVALQGKPLRVVNDQFCTPTATQDLARQIIGLIKANCQGLYHGVNSGATTWHDFASEIFRLSGVTADLTPIPSQDYPTPARRPRYSVLSTEKIRCVPGVQVRPWQQALSDYLSVRAKKLN